MPGGKQAFAYQFYTTKINDNNLLRFLTGDPFKGKVPSGWQKIVEDAPATQVGAHPSAVPRK